MKTKLLLSALLFSAFSFNAQTLFTVHDYDDCKTLSFGGNTAQTEREVPVTNPSASDTANPNVTKFTPKLRNSAVYLKLPYLTGTIGNLDWQFRYFSDIAGTVDSGSGRLIVRLLNTSVSGADGFTQLELFNKEGGSWQTKSGNIDLSTASATVKAAGGFDSLVFVLNNVNGATDPPLNPVFIDDVALSVNPNLSDDSSDLLDTNGWILNYNGGQEINKFYVQSNLIVEENITSPSTEGNLSTNVMKITRQGEGNEDTQSPFIQFDIDPINYTDGGIVKFRIYPDCKLGVTTNARFMLRKDDVGTTQRVTGVISLIPNIWNEVEVDLATLAGASSTPDNIYNNMLIFFNFADPSMEALGTTFYLDAVQAPAAAVLSAEDSTLEAGLKLLGNPVSKELSLSKEANSIRIYTITGKTILTVNSKSNTYNVSSLANGVYFAEASFESSKKVFKFIKN
jgi:hypothetical protein